MQLDFAHLFPRPFRDPCRVRFPIRYNRRSGFFTSTNVSSNDWSVASLFTFFFFVSLDSAENSGASAPPIRKNRLRAVSSFGMVFKRGESNRFNAARMSAARDGLTERILDYFNFSRLTSKNATQPVAFLLTKSQGSNSAIFRIYRGPKQRFLPLPYGSASGAEHLQPCW